MSNYMLSGRADFAVYQCNSNQNTCSVVTYMNLFLFSVESYLQDIHVQSLNNSVGVNAIPTGAHIRDDEQVCLTLLLF